MPNLWLCVCSRTHASVSIYVGTWRLCLCALMKARQSVGVPGAPGSFAYVTLVSNAENCCVPANWTTTWMHVLIRYLGGFSASLSPPLPICHVLTLWPVIANPQPFPESKLTKKTSLLLFVFFPLLHAIDKHTWAHWSARGWRFIIFLRRTPAFLQLLLDAVSILQEFHLSAETAGFSKQTQSFCVF